MPRLAKPTSTLIPKKDTKKVVSPAKLVSVPVETKIVNFSHPNLKISPRKLRLLVNDIKRHSPSVAVTELQFVNTNAARIYRDVLKNAIANAKNNHHLLPDTLKCVEARVDEGLKIKRMDKSHGSRFARGVKQKRHSRLTIVLSGTIQS